jgi:hypothetical protein
VPVLWACKEIIERLRQQHITRVVSAQLKDTSCVADRLPPATMGSSLAHTYPRDVANRRQQCYMCNKKARVQGAARGVPVLCVCAEFQYRSYCSMWKAGYMRGVEVQCFVRDKKVMVQGQVCSTLCLYKKKTKTQARPQQFAHSACTLCLLTFLQNVSQAAAVHIRHQAVWVSCALELCKSTEDAMHGCQLPLLLLQ